jgi:hypothetical protein
LDIVVKMLVTNGPNCGSDDGEDSLSVECAKGRDSKFLV